MFLGRHTFTHCYDPTRITKPKTFQIAKGNQSVAAEILGICRVTVWNRMKRFGITCSRQIESTKEDCQNPGLCLVSQGSIQGACLSVAARKPANSDKSAPVHIRSLWVYLRSGSVRTDWVTGVRWVMLTTAGRMIAALVGINQLPALSSVWLAARRRRFHRARRPAGQESLSLRSPRGTPRQKVD